MQSLCRQHPIPQNTCNFRESVSLVLRRYVVLSENLNVLSSPCATGAQVALVIVCGILNMLQLALCII